MKKAQTLSDEPELFPDVLWIWDAFSFLSATRGISYNGPVRITAAEMLSYCIMKGIIISQGRDDLMYFIPILDTQYLEDHYRKAEIQQRKAESKNKSH